MSNTKNVVRRIDDISAIGAQDYDVCVPETSFRAMFEGNARRWPDRPALSVLDRSGAPVLTRTHAQLADDVLDMAALMAGSLRQGQSGVVAVMCRNEALLTPLIWGTQIAGIVSCLNYLLDTVNLCALLAAERAEVMVIPGPDVDADLWEKGRGVAASSDLLHTIFVLGRVPADADPRMIALEDALTQIDRTHLPAPRDDADRISAMFHTGGTTGVPKLVPLSQKNQIHAAWSFGCMFDLRETDVILNGLPMFHVGGTITFHLAFLYAGGHMVLAGQDGFRTPDIVSGYWRLVEAYRATAVGAVPTTIGALAATPVAGADISSLRLAITGGAGISPSVAERFEQQAGVPLLEQYGMTETCATIASTPFHGPRLRGSAGLSGPFSAVRIAGDDGETALPAGQAGAVQVKGPQVFAGYLDPAHNEGLFTADGWMNTGDIGQLTDLGQLVLSGRSKDVIIRSAHNIDPKVIEIVADSHPDVALSAAVGLPDAYAGEVPVVFVQTVEGRRPDVQMLRDFICERVPEPPARPRHLWIIDKIPTTGVGKIFKPELRERALERKVMMMLDEAGAQTQGLTITADLQSGKRAVVRILHGAALADSAATLAAALADMNITLNVEG